METIEHVGLLFVHGIGEQKRFEHLQNTIKELTAHLGDVRFTIDLNVKSAGERAPDDVSFDRADAPIRFTVVTANNVIVFHCHEVWWSDLGIGGGLTAQLRFWIWALGQWYAKVYDRPATRSGQQLFVVPKLPENGGRIWTRLMLLWSSLIAVWSLLSWSILKRLLALVNSNFSFGSTVFRFLGDVKLYEGRGRLGEGPMSDPGLPPRVSLRRRMVREMVAMPVRGYDRWYILAHSLGTILAYNALMEPDHCLPNYLTEQQWTRVERALRGAPVSKGDVNDMWPRRPVWLEDADAIDRQKLFTHLAGVLTYGSPLELFARIWPSIVLINKAPQPFPAHMEWVNVYDPIMDPITAKPRSHQSSAPNGSSWRAPIDVSYRASSIFAIAHTRYLSKTGRLGPAVIDWITRATAFSVPKHPNFHRVAGAERIAWAALQILIVAGLMLLGASLALKLSWTAITGLLAKAEVWLDWSVLSAIRSGYQGLTTLAAIAFNALPDGLEQSLRILWTSLSAILPAVLVGLVIVTMCGLRRYAYEKKLDVDPS
jgi:hypothetical protein